MSILYKNATLSVYTEVRWPFVNPLIHPNICFHLSPQNNFNTPGTLPCLSTVSLGSNYMNRNGPTPVVSVIVFPLGLRCVSRIFNEKRLCLGSKSISQLVIGFSLKLWILVFQKDKYVQRRDWCRILVSPAPVPQTRSSFFLFRSRDGTWTLYWKFVRWTEVLRLTMEINGRSILVQILLRVTTTLLGLLQISYFKVHK